MRQLGQEVRRRRAVAGWSQEELAWRAELHRTFLADIERGQRNPSMWSLMKLASSFGCSIDAIVPELPPPGTAERPR